MHPVGIPVKLFQLPFVMLSMVLVACSGDEAPTATHVATPKVVQLSPVTLANEQQSYQFPATVKPVKTVKLNFEVSGRLNFTDMIQGTTIKKGHLLATMDSAPFERRVRENFARHKQARLELDRLLSLYEKKLAAKRDLDNAETQFEITLVDLENSRQDLSDSKLEAPFDALISERLLENDSYISAGTAVVTLQDVSKVRFELNVSERILSANISNEIISAQAFINGAINKTFDIHYIEHTTEPDPVTQTYKVLFEMDPPEGIRLTPGLRAYVEVNVQNKHHEAGIVVPLNAIVPLGEQRFSVWKYQPESKTVTAAAIDVATISGNFAIVRAGLEEGDEVVSAGVSQMNEGLLVQRYVAE
ncbi:efflux RND transporter periplasmic adaptor subunit [Corallincola spongiicola]|uniref:Efflux RND transporter periplasmic adaptor subunit n=1 Tax=Corallincola spongiicola TaxID=2520508 RepID=A0ABY1WSV3_9GAMM|nr:efflux RND transporter periplasmic adaptor subunit [Corallincola spongiicola]